MYGELDMNENLSLGAATMRLLFRNLLEVFKVQGAWDPANTLPTWFTVMISIYITWQHPIERAPCIPDTPWSGLWVDPWEPSHVGAIQLPQKAKYFILIQVFILCFMLLNVFLSWIYMKYLYLTVKIKTKQNKQLWHRTTICNTVQYICCCHVVMLFIWCVVAKWHHRIYR